MTVAHIPDAVFTAHCCDSCAAQYKVLGELQNKTNQSKYCELCGHYGPGGDLQCTFDHWLSTKPLSVLRPGSVGE